MESRTIDFQISQSNAKPAIATLLGATNPIYNSPTHADSFPPALVDWSADAYDVAGSVYTSNYTTAAIISADERLLVQTFGNWTLAAGVTTINDTSAASNDTTTTTNQLESGPNNYWALMALGLVFGTAAGNILVCLAICWERRLQNVTNYFLMSLAITDLMVAILVMPLGIVTLVKGLINYCFHIIITFHHIYIFILHVDYYIVCERGVFIILVAYRYNCLCLGFGKVCFMYMFVVDYLYLYCFRCTSRINRWIVFTTIVHRLNSKTGLKKYSITGLRIQKQSCKQRHRKTQLSKSN